MAMTLTLVCCGNTSKQGENQKYLKNLNKCEKLLISRTKVPKASLIMALVTEPSYSNERIGRLCTIPIIIQVRAAAKHTLPLLPLLPFFSFFPCVSEQNGGPKKALNPQIRGTEGV